MDYTITKFNDLHFRITPKGSDFPYIIHQVRDVYEIYFHDYTHLTNVTVRWVDSDMDRLYKHILDEERDLMEM